jgi:small subunit ribosomal protein S16
VVKLKLKRLGAPHKPSYRIVVMDSKKSPGSDYIEALGTYRPLESDETKQVTFDEAKVLSWLNKGAQPTEKTLALLKKAKLWKKFIDSKNLKEA